MTIRDLLGISPSLRAMPEKKRTARKDVPDVRAEAWALNRAQELNARGVSARVETRRREAPCVVYRLPLAGV